LKKHDREKNEAEYVRMASDFAESHGYDLNAYSVTSTNCMDQVLIIVFQGKSGLPGDHFSVQVDRSTQEVMRLIPGR